MKIFYKFLSALFLFLLSSLTAHAQLNGVYTINSAVATGGTNYQTFNAFAAVINTAGISGPVTVNVVSGSGPYNEQVNFTAIAGTSSTNTITINGNGCTIVFNATVTTARHTFMLSGTDYMTVNNLNIEGTNATSALVVHLWNDASNNTFKNCLITAPLNGTTSTQVPFSISGTSVSPTAAGNGGNNNTVSTCTMTGGYYSTVFYGSSAAPFNTGNKLLNSVVRDFYLYGFYNVYCQNTTAKSNIVDRLNRNTVSTTYAMYLSTGSIANGLIEGNHIRNLFNGNPGSTSTAYCIYLIADASLNNENVVKNNVISNINSNGTIYGIYISGAAFANVFHNTVSLDDATATAGTTYGIYASGPNDKVKNNIVTIGRGGSGTKYGLYYTTASLSLESDFNDVYISANQGTNYTAYYTTGYITLQDWQQGFPAYDQNSRDADPVYTNTATLNYVPTSTVINNMCPNIGVTTDFNNFPRDPATPDPGAFEFYTTPCSGTPGANSVITPTYIVCPGTTLNIGLANTFTNTGYTVQWQSSTTSSLGPFTPVPGATLSVFNTSTLNTTTYYNAVITCTITSGSANASVGSVLIASTTINNVPYFENFEGISKNNQLPNCSWSASSQGSTNLTYTNNGTFLRVPHSGAKFASFSNTPAGTSYFYSNGINMYPGITYSAALWYIAETMGYNNWSDLSIVIGTTQTTAGHTTIATVAPVAPVLYQSLSNTFVVTQPGIYYVAIKATSGSGASPYLSWDDLSITIPCSINGPSLTLTPNATTICAGQPVNILATGANTYTWNTGSNNPSITETPATSITYIAVGANTLSGCSSTVSQNITVNPSPQIVVSASSSVVCSGSPAGLTAQGGGLYQYTWAHGVNGPYTSVNPTVTTTYSVAAINGFGCAKTATMQIAVNPLPNVSGIPSANQVCIGEPVSLTGNGAIFYEWTNNGTVIYSGNPVTVMPQASSIYTMTAKDQNGCYNTALVILAVDECTGLAELNDNRTGRVFPNPSNGLFTVELSEGAVIGGIYDVTGRQVSGAKVTTQRSDIDIRDLPSGLYYMRVVSAERINVIRIIKQ